MSQSFDMRLSLLLIVGLLTFELMLCPYRVSADELSYADELVARATELKLAESQTWTRLLHYQKNQVLPGVHSLADDPNFFLSEQGKSHPEAELEATIRAFFRPHEIEKPTDPIGEQLSFADKQHPQCAFPARYHWLKEQLHFDPAKLDEELCTRFQEWRNSLAPEALTLVFPAAYLNNPASMFGHTLLRIDAAGQDEQSRLLAYGANYAAATRERSGFVFAVRGIFGLYKGIFSIAPYYKQVTKYSDLENRDIWEYQLNFSTEEREQIIRHLWELGSVYFDYYFFDENCSYHLLSLLEAGRPDLKLTNQFHFAVIPSDTVREVEKVPGLVSQTIYRPSNSTMIRKRLSMLSSNDQAKALALAQGEIESDHADLLALPEIERARVYELAYEYVNYQRLRGKDTSATTPGRARKILLARSLLKTPEEKIVPEPPKVRPDEGHASRRITFRSGGADEKLFTELEFRPAYHDLLDREEGYIHGAELRFFDTAFRYREGDSFKLEHFLPLAITSLSPRDDFFHSASWNVQLGVERKFLRESREQLVYEATGGAGVSYQIFQNGLFYLLLDPHFQYSESYEDRSALGGGVIVGVTADLNEWFRVQGLWEGARYVLGEEHTEHDISAAARVSFGLTQAVRLEGKHSFSFGDYHNSLSVAWQYFF